MVGDGESGTRIWNVLLVVVFLWLTVTLLIPPRGNLIHDGQCRVHVEEDVFYGRGELPPAEADSHFYVTKGLYHNMGGICEDGEIPENGTVTVQGIEMWRTGTVVEVNGQRLEPNQSFTSESTRLTPRKLLFSPWFLHQRSVEIRNHGRVNVSTHDGLNRTAAETDPVIAIGHIERDLSFNPVTALVYLVLVGRYVIQGIGRLRS